MGFTKVAPAGIGTEPGDGYRIGDSFLHATGISLGSGTTISHSGSASFSGIVTFKSAKLIQEIATLIPDDKILVETDAPYLSPTPLRGSVNEPKNCSITAKYLADIRKCEFSTFIDQLYMNSFKIFDKIS